MTPQISKTNILTAGRDDGALLLALSSKQEFSWTGVTRTNTERVQRTSAAKINLMLLGFFLPKRYYSLQIMQNEC